MTDAKFDEKSTEPLKESLQISTLSSVERLLETGLLQGLRVTCFPEEHGTEVPGVIKGSGLLCGCSQCNYKSKVLSAKVFEEHAGANTMFQTDHIFFSNEINLYEVFQVVRNVPKDDFFVKILKLRVDVKDEKFYEEPPRVPITSFADKSCSSVQLFILLCRTKSKRSGGVIHRHIASVRNDLKESSRKSSSFDVEVINKQFTRVKKSKDSNEATCVLDLLKSGLLEGAHINYISETTQENFPGFIKGTGYVCGFSKYSYTGENLSSHEYQKHVGCTAFMPSNQMFLSNGYSILEVARKIRSLHGNARKRRLNVLVSLLEFRENNNRAEALRTFICNESDKEKLSAVSDLLHDTFGTSKQLKYYTRYNPERRLIDVRGLLSTGLLEGFRVTYKRNEARLEALIRGSAYKCGCSSCNYAKVITAKELEAHTGEFSKNRNENIYLDSGITLYKLVDKLKGIPLYFLGKFLQEKIKCSPNYSSFEIWKGSFKMEGGFQNLCSNFDGQLEVNSKCCSVQRKSRELGSIGSTSYPSLVRERRNSAGSAVCNGSLNFGGPEEHLSPASRKTRSPRISKFKESSSDRGVVHTGLVRGVQKHVYIFEFSGSESTRISDVMNSDIEDPDYSPLDSTSKGLTGEKSSPLRRIVKTRGKYENVYNSDGKMLHELSSELTDIPRTSSGVASPGHGKSHQYKHHKNIAKPLLNSTQDFAVSTRLRLKRVLQSQKGVLVRCTICKERCASLGDDADKKLIIFCNQCDRAYHVGCLKDQESFKIEDVLNGSWFCCTDCTWVHNCLINICALSAKPVPPPFLDSVKRLHAAEKNRLNLYWQVLGGGNTEDQMLLSQALKFLKGAFRPILHGKEDIIRQMIFGKRVAGTGQDFRGVLCIVIKLNEEIISIAVLRVFGKLIAELPLVTSSKLWRQRGYFHMLLSLIEELLCLLQVRLLVAPVHKKMEAIWIHKFGFVKASDHKVQLLNEQHGLILFEDTALLEKEIQVVTD